ncbi:YciI-like protein [Sphingomonas sp. dw_22]|uniref:YciI-like protein n=1 Tax=Sphingomonas sp. dw_22 TaxID=2721175 RepID=UPI001BD62431|nr:YciI-like protein [Sphingomonas sp. dw_22]
MRHFLLFYEYGPDFEVRRAEVREQHLARAWAASARGELVLAGALADPFDTGVLLFRADSAVTAEEFAQSDPYVTNGLVTAWRVREWITAVGEEAASPVGKPADTRENNDE